MKYESWYRSTILNCHHFVAQTEALSKCRKVCLSIYIYIYIYKIIYRTNNSINCWVLPSVALLIIYYTVYEGTILPVTCSVEVFSHIKWEKPMWSTWKLYEREITGVGRSVKECFKNQRQSRHSKNEIKNVSNVEGTIKKPLI